MLRFLERLLVFPAPAMDKADWNPQDLDFEDVYFHGEDGTPLHGWYVAHPRPRATILYCHGNGEHVAQLAPWLKILKERIGVSVFAWDYRSYGRSDGIPHESNVLSDAKIAHHWLADRTGRNPAEVVMMGRSLGGAVAVALAAQHSVRAIVLDRTFSTLTDAASHHFPWLPVRWIMNNRFPSIDHIRNYHGPLLQSHGTIDQIVPLHQGRQLFDASPSKVKKFLEVPDCDHNSPLPDYWYQEMVTFLDALSPLGDTNCKQ